MGTGKIYLGKNEINTFQSGVSGQFVEIGNEKFYQIKNFHEMPDFFISIVSDSNHWMFISSNGSLSAGRKDRDNALFPYYTVDKIHDYKNITGSKSCFLVTKNDKTYLWEPFTDESQKTYKICRNLYKNFYGNKLIFEEINTELGLSFRYGWYNSDKFGFVKKSRIINHSGTGLQVSVLDGIQNILPNGVGYSFQNEYSNLLDAYKKSERIKESTLGIFMLSSIPVDRAEPSEALKATSVWSLGLDKDSKILISNKQFNDFRNGLDIHSEYDIRAARGAYFIHSKFDLQKDESREWYTIAEINQDSTDVFNLNTFLGKTDNIKGLIETDINKGTEDLKKKVAFADGFQLSNTEMCYARHYSNTLNNIMRGGVFPNNYTVDSNDFKDYTWQINKLLSKELSTWLEALPEEISYIDLLHRAKETRNDDLLRITYEYLPLTFSRRHGDPSRPWNLFSIETKNMDGSVKFNYEGNWRDIFQNWEALCYSFPEFVEGIIGKFVNASTIDGYNPYRIMRKGIDWEAPDPNDPWAYIGYWGDHQIIYLQKLLELSDRFHPGKLDGLLVSDIFTYANVPYQVKPYDEIIKDTKNTVVFNHELNDQIKSEAAHLGADAKLLKHKNSDQVFRVNLTEKILVSLLSKISNFIPEAGIWLNTQRPEWNDANNALVGNGTSMVTLFYLRRSLKFWANKFENISHHEISVSEEVASLFETIHKFLEKNIHLIDNGFSDSDRKYFADHLGRAHSDYRNDIYTYSFSGLRSQLKFKDLLAFANLCLKYIDHSIEANRREDGLYHSYNLISINKGKISIRHLYEMLEGQVAVLSSGLLTAKESLHVLNTLKSSDMFRADQYSYMLYPDRQLPRFMDKNIIPEHFINESALLKKMVEIGDKSIITKDDAGNFHFNGSFRNAAGLSEALSNLHAGSYSLLIKAEKDKILDIYERVFDHQSFTGRSGTFYGYEGLGSIYWHMVSKLLLATQENYFKAVAEGEDKNTISQLKDHYYEIKAGIGLYKSPELYGGFPMDPYSHTPGNAGVKQPGLTGQVKEDFISRLMELGIQIGNGELSFNSSLLNPEEFLDKPAEYEFHTLNGQPKTITLTRNQLAFTFCQVPVIYTKSEHEDITILYTDGKETTLAGNSLDKELSSHILKRSGLIEVIKVSVKIHT